MDEPRAKLIQSLREDVDSLEARGMYAQAKETYDREWGEVVGQMVGTMLRGGDPLKEWGGSIAAHPELLQARASFLRSMGEAQVNEFLKNDPRAGELDQAYASLMGQYEALNAAAPKIDPRMSQAEQEAAWMQYRSVAMPSEEFDRNYALINGLNRDLKAKFGNHVSVFNHPRTQHAARALTMELGSSDLGYFTTKHDIDYLPQSFPGWARGSVAQGIAAAAYAFGEMTNEAISVPAGLAAGAYDIIGRFGAKVFGHMIGRDERAMEDAWEALYAPRSYTLDKEGQVVPVAGGRVAASNVAGLLWSAFSEEGAKQMIANTEAEREFIASQQSGLAATVSNTGRFLGFLSGFTYGGGGAMLGKGISMGGAAAGGGKAFYNAWRESSRGLAILRAGGSGGPWQAARATKVRTILGELAGGAAAFGAFESVINGRVEGYAQSWMHGAMQYPIIHAAGALGRATSGVLMRKKLPAYISRGIGATIEGTGLTVAGFPNSFLQNSPEGEALWAFLQDPSMKTAEAYYDVWAPNVLGMILWSGITGRTATGQRQRMSEEVQAGIDAGRAQKSGRSVVEEQARTAMRGYMEAKRKTEPSRRERRDEIQYLYGEKREQARVMNAYTDAIKLVGKQAQRQGYREAVLETWGIPVEQQGDYLRFVPRDKEDVLGRFMDFTRKRMDRGEVKGNIAMVAKGADREIGMVLTRSTDGIVYAAPVKGEGVSVDLMPGILNTMDMIKTDFGAATALDTSRQSPKLTIHTHPTISPPSMQDLGVFFSARGPHTTASHFIVSPHGAWVLTPKPGSDPAKINEMIREVDLAGGVGKSIAFKEKRDKWIKSNLFDVPPEARDDVARIAWDIVSQRVSKPLPRLLSDIKDPQHREWVKQGVQGFIDGVTAEAKGLGFRMDFIPEKDLAAAWQKTMRSKDLRYHSDTADLVKERNIEVKTRSGLSDIGLDGKKPHRDLFTDLSRKHLTRVFERTFQDAMDSAKGIADENSLRNYAEGQREAVTGAKVEPPEWFKSAMEPFYDAVDSIGRIKTRRSASPIEILHQIGVKTSAISKRFRFTTATRPDWSVSDQGRRSPEAHADVKISLVEKRARQFLAKELREAGLNPNASRADLAGTADRWISYRGDPVPPEIIARVNAKIEAMFGPREERLSLGKELRGRFMDPRETPIVEVGVVPPRKLGELNEMVDRALKITTEPRQFKLEMPRDKDDAGSDLPDRIPPKEEKPRHIDFKIVDEKRAQEAAGRKMLDDWAEQQARETKLGKEPTPKELWDRTKAGVKRLFRQIGDYLTDKNRRLEVADAVRRIGYRNRNFGGFDEIGEGFENTMLSHTDRVRIRIRNAPRAAMDAFGEIMRPIWERSNTIKDPETGERGQLDSKDVSREIQQVVEYAWLKDIVSNHIKQEKVPIDGPEFREELRHRSPPFLNKRAKELWASGRITDMDAAKMARNAAIAQGRKIGMKVSEMAEQLRKLREDLEVEAADWTKDVEMKLPGNAPIESFMGALDLLEKSLLPRQKESYENMRTVLDTAFDSLKRRGAITEAARRENYFPRQVVDYGDVFQSLGPLKPGKRLPFRPYSKERKGSARLHEMTSEALLSYLTKVQIDNAKHDWMATIAIRAQDQVERRIGKTAEDMKAMGPKEWNTFFDEVVKPEDLVVFDANSGTLGRFELERDAGYQALVNHINSRMPEGMRLPDAVELGRYWRPDPDKFRYLVPKQLADWFVKAQDTGSSPFYGLMFNVNRQVISPIKLAMLRGFGGIGTFGRAVRNILSDVIGDLQKGGKDYGEGMSDFLRKFVGDVYIPSREVDGKGVKLGGAAHRIALALAQGDISKLSDFEQSIAREADYFGTVRSGRFTSGEEFAPSNRDLSPWLRTIYPQTTDRIRRWAKAMLLGDYNTARVVDEYAENVQRIAFFMRHRMERFEEMAGRKYEIEDELSKVYRNSLLRLTELAHVKTGETLVSYQWLTPVERYLMNGMLVPFYTWARGNFQGTVAAALEKPGAFAAKIGTITALSAIWNTLMAPEEEQRLASVNPSIASRFHLFVPWWKDSLGNTAMIFMLEDPALEALDLIFGLGSAPAKVQNFVHHQDPSLLMRDLVQGGIDDWQQSVRDLAAPWLRWFGDESYQARYMDLGERAGQMVKGGTSAFRPLTDINRLLLDSTRSNEQAAATLVGPFLHFVDLTRGLPARQRATDLSIGREERASATLRSDIRRNLKRYMASVNAGTPEKTLAIMDETWERFEDRLTPLGISRIDVYARFQRARQEFERREFAKTLPTNIPPRFFEQSGKRQRRQIIQQLIEETR